MPKPTTTEELLRRYGLNKPRKGRLPLITKLAPSLKNKTEKRREYRVAPSLTWISLFNLHLVEIQLFEDFLSVTNHEPLHLSIKAVEDLLDSNGNVSKLAMFGLQLAASIIVANKRTLDNPSRL